MSRRGERAGDEFERVRSVIWNIDPLDVAADRELAPDEYDDLAWRMVSAINRHDHDGDIDAEWNRLLEDLMGNSTSIVSGYTACLHARCAHSFARSLRGEVSYHAYP